MKRLECFLILWTTLSKAYLAEVKTDITLEKWESRQSREDVCALLSELRQTDPAGFDCCTVVSPSGFVYTALEFLTDLCPVCVPAQPTREPGLDAAGQPPMNFSEYSIYLEADGLWA